VLLKTQAFILRTPLSTRQNWTLGISWDLDQHTTVGIIRGLAENEMSTLLSALNDTNMRSRHPLTIPFLLCEMLADVDSNDVKGHAADLFQGEIKTKTYGDYQSTTRPVCLIPSSALLY